MLSIPLIAVFFVVSIWGFFSPVVAGWTFAVLAAAFLGWSAWIASTPRVEPYFLEEAEAAVFRQYPLYFTSPFLARQYAGVCPWVFRLGLLWVALLLWKAHYTAGSVKALYVAAGVIAVLAFGSAYVRRLLNPADLLRARDKQGRLTPEQQARLEEIDAIESKIHYARESELDRRRSTIRGRLV